MRFARLVIAAAFAVFFGTAWGQPHPASISAASGRLLQEYSTAHDLRAFALQAKGRPSEGGIFYAKYVANICGRKFPVTDLPRRCSGFAAGEPASLLDEINKTPFERDPLLTAEKHLRAAVRGGARDQIRAAMVRAMELDDPLLWTHQRLWDAVAQSDPEAKKSLGFYLDGVVYSDKDGLKHLEAYTALELGFCKPGLPCALDDELAIICATGGACAPDREAKTKNFYLDNGGLEVGWQSVLALVARVRTALANRNVAFFVR